MKILLLIQLEKGNHSLRTVKGNWLSLFSMQRNFVLIRQNSKAHQLPSFISWPAKSAWCLYTCNTEILICWECLPRKLTDILPLTLTESSSLNIHPTSHLSTKTSETIFKWGWEKGAAGQDLSVQIGLCLAVATNPPPNEHCMKCLVMWNVSPSSLFSLWSVP